MKSKKNIQRVIAVWMTLMLLICGTPAVFAKDVVHIRSAEDLIAFSKSCVLDTWSQNKTVHYLPESDRSGQRSFLWYLQY